MADAEVDFTNESKQIESLIKLIALISQIKLDAINDRIDIHAGSY